MDTEGFKVSDLENNEFHREVPDLNMDAVFQPGTDASFAPSKVNDFVIRPTAEDPCLLEDEEDKEESLRPPTTPVFKKPN